MLVNVGESSRIKISHIENASIEVDNSILRQHVFYKGRLYRYTEKINTNFVNEARAIYKHIDNQHHAEINIHAPNEHPQNINGGCKSRRIRKYIKK
jgi:hypothetical protein